MKNSFCPNYTSCKLVTIDGFLLTEEKKVLYLNNYCVSTKKAWEQCARFYCKTALGFCPDFLLPDTKLSLDEIIDKFDDENK